MLLIAILLIVLVVPIAFFIVGAMLSAPTYRGPVSDHFDGRKFMNPTGIKAKGFTDVLKWATNRKRGPWKPDLREQFGPRPLARETEHIRITFVNHSTFLIQVDGINILTDPVWSMRTSPFSWAGPKRMRLPGVRLEDLPPIHLVLLSHNHYDHLDIATLRTIFGAHHPKLIVPLGVKKFLDDQWIGGSTELDWWQETSEFEKLSIEAVPAQHFSGRGMLDRDGTLWCGFVVKSSRGIIYFAGDTGYNEITFKEIGKKFGRIRAAIVPIGAYEPRWFMSPIHTSPADAVKIHIDVNAQLSIGSHFGTFPLADEGQDQPKRDLEDAMKTLGVPDGNFIVLQEGQPFVIEH